MKETDRMSTMEFQPKLFKRVLLISILTAMPKVLLMFSENFSNLALLLGYYTVKFILCNCINELGQRQ
jgi:hypothetical protein